MKCAMLEYLYHVRSSTIAKPLPNTIISSYQSKQNTFYAHEECEVKSHIARIPQ